MSKDWYLLSTPYGQLSGFESEALADFAADGFAELTASGVGYDVELYNYDLSICKHAKAIVQNNTAETRLNTMNRQMLFPIGTSKAGMYVKYKNRFWLIVGLVDDNMVYEKAVLIICNHLLSWINANGEIIQRWVHASSAAQYNNGETSTRNYYIRSDQLLVFTPDDDECLLLNSGQRLIIDKRCSVYERGFHSDTTIDTSNPVTVYKITRNDSVLFNYQDSGHSEFMAYQDEQHENDGYYVVNGKGYWLCDIPHVETDETLILSCAIECESDVIYAQLEPGVFTAKAYDDKGNEISIKPMWEITSDIDDDLFVEYIGNSVLISTDNPACANKTFDITLSADGLGSITKTITIRAFL